MISQVDLQTIATVFGKTSDEISSAISQENEIALGLRLPGKVYTQEEIDDLKTSVRGAGVEIGLKQVGKIFGVDLSGEDKTPDLIAQKIKTTISKEFEEKYKNQTPSDELIELKKQIEEQQKSYEKLKGTYDTTITQVDEWKNKYSELENNYESKELNNKILGYLPEKLKLEKEDALNLIRLGVQVEKTDNGVIYKRNGQIITDAVGKPEILENIVKSFVEEKKWIRGSGMNGKDTEIGGSGLPKGLTESDAYKWLEDRNIEPMSEEGTEKFIQLTSK